MICCPSPSNHFPLLISSQNGNFLSPTSLQNPTPTTHLLHNFNSQLELKQLHAHLTKTATPLSLLPLIRVTSVCTLKPSFVDAQQIFERVEHCPNTAIIWNSCLKAFAEGDTPSAVLVFYGLRPFNVLPNAFTCSFVLKACCRVLDVSNGRIVHGFIEKPGFQLNSFLQNMILQLYASCGAMGDAHQLFDKMRERDVVSWNIMITQLVKREDIVGARGLFLQMPQRNVRLWTAMIAGCVQCEKPKEAVDLFLEMEATGLRPNEVTVVGVLAACADLGSLDPGRRIHKYSDENGFRRNTRICNTIIDMYVKCGCLEDSRRVFNEMEERTVVSWSAMIAGLAMHGRAQDALKLFSKMKQAGVKPNGVTFIGLLHACSHMGLVDEGRNLFASMTRDYRIIPRIEHYG